MRGAARTCRKLFYDGACVSQAMIRLAACVMMALVMAVPVAFAEPLAVAVGQDVYHYGDYLNILITVEDLTEPVALVYIRDSSGVASSPIPVTLTQLSTELPSPLPFDRETYPEGEYFVDVRYAGFEATTRFELVDAGNVVVPNWIKQVGFLWANGEISDWAYLDALSRLVEQGVITVPGDGGEEPYLPPWVVYATVWWLQGQISDGSYVGMIQYLVDIGMITGLAQ